MCRKSKRKFRFAIAARRTSRSFCVARCAVRTANGPTRCRRTIHFASQSCGSVAEAAAEAVVTDPCLWSEELPHLYHANVEALRGDVVVAEYHGEIGLRRTSPAKNWDHIK